MADLPTPTITGATVKAYDKKIRMAPATRAFRAAMADTIVAHSLKTKPDSMLAAAAHLVGMVLAIQNPRTMTLEDAEYLIRRNIVEGNTAAREMLNKAANLK